jgi:hypothetical protein
VCSGFWSAYTYVGGSSEGRLGIPHKNINNTQERKGKISLKERKKEGKEGNQVKKEPGTLNSRIYAKKLELCEYSYALLKPKKKITAKRKNTKRNLGIGPRKGAERLLLCISISECAI